MRLGLSKRTAPLTAVCAVEGCQYHEAPSTPPTLCYLSIEYHLRCRNMQRCSRCSRCTGHQQSLRQEAGTAGVGQHHIPTIRVLWAGKGVRSPLFLSRSLPRSRLPYPARILEQDCLSLPHAHHRSTHFVSPGRKHALMRAVRNLSTSSASG